jgi:SAM-dependent methyltransferase
MKYLHNEGHEVTGVETNSEFIAENSRLNPGLPIFKTTGTVLPCGDSEFDIVMSFDVFEHIPNSNDHLSEVRRVLRPNGHYLLATPNKWTNVLFEPIRHARKRGLSKAFDFFKTHCALHNYWQLARRFKLNGFETEFYDVPVVNEFFRVKVNRFLGKPGLLALRLVNPDMLPRPLRTNFFLKARKLKSDL